MLRSSFRRTVVASCLAAFVTAPAAWAQPDKSKPPAAETRPDGDQRPDDAAGGKKVMTESEKAESGKPKPKPAEPADDDDRPPPVTGAAKPTRGP